MANDKFQYHVFNQHISFIISIGIESEEYAVSLAKRTAVDFYDYEEVQALDLQAQLINGYRHDSVINVKMLNDIVDGAFPVAEEVEAPRVCESCKKSMSEGYMVERDLIRYYCSSRCLGKDVSVDDYLYMYRKGTAFWTTWEDEEKGEGHV